MIIAGLLLLGAAGAGCNSLEMKADWAAKPITVDGSGSDWDDLHTAFFEDQEAVVGVASDSSRLYLLFRCRDDKYARTITMSGLNISLTAEADEAEKMTIKYRGGPSRDDLSTLQGPDSEPVPLYPIREVPDGDRLGGDRPNRGPSFTVAIEDRVLEKAIAEDGGDGPAAAYALSDGMYTWEFSIPLDHSKVRYYGLGADPGGEVKAEVAWGEMDRPSMPKPPEGMGGGMGGGPPGGGGGMGGGPPGGGGGGMGGGPPGGGGPGGSRSGNMPEKQEVKFKIALAASSVSAEEGDQ